MRNYLAPDSPYEMWVFSCEPRSGGSAALPTAILWAMICGTFWGILLTGHLRTGKGLDLSMRQWVMICLIFLAVLALAILRYSALYLIETRKARLIQTAHEEALTRLEETDTGITAVFDHFARECGRIAFDRAWGRRIMDDSPDRVSRAAHQADRLLRNSNPPISLHYLLRYKAAETLERRTFNLGSHTSTLGESLPLFFHPFIEEGARQMGYSAVASAPTENVADAIQKMFAEIIRASLKETAFQLFKNFRQKTDVLENTRDVYLYYYDFLASKGKLAGCVMFLARAKEAYQRYLKVAVPHLGAAGKAWFAFGLRQFDGCQIVFPEQGSITNSHPGLDLIELMQLSSVADSVQGQKLDEYLLVSLPCLFAKGFVLGAVVPLRKILDDQKLQLQLLDLAIVAFLFLIILLGRATADHLLEPLSRVEEGLRLVAAGDLEQRLDLHRADELGDLSSTFDRLLLGLRERRDLGRFVSGDVDALVTRQDSGETLAPQRRTGTVLVADLRQFTTLSESHPAAVIVAMLNRHHQEMVEAILARGGSVELFIGDAVVAVFYDRDGTDAAERAVRAGLEMRQRHTAIQEERRRRGEFLYEMGTGIDRGEVLVGTFGREGRLEHTVLGPPRLRAERLEASTKKGSRTRVMVSPLVASLCPRLEFARISSEAWELVGEASG